MLSISGLAVDRRGRVYVTDSSNGTLQAFSPAGTLLLDWDAANHPELGLRAPSAIALDQAGNIYVADGGRIIEIAALG